MRPKNPNPPACHRASPCGAPVVIFIGPVELPGHFDPSLPQGEYLELHPEIMLILRTDYTPPYYLHRTQPRGSHNKDCG